MKNGMMPRHWRSLRSVASAFLKVVSCILFSILFSGCEGTIGYRGVVLDGETGKPLEGVQVAWIIRGHPIEKVREVYDTLPCGERDKFRAISGATDDFSDVAIVPPYSDTAYWDNDSTTTSNLEERYYTHYVESYSDSNGKFETGPMFVGMVLPLHWVIRFTKPGYDTLLVPEDSKRKIVNLIRAH